MQRFRGPSRQSETQWLAKKRYSYSSHCQSRLYPEGARTRKIETSPFFLASDRGYTKTKFQKAEKQHAFLVPTKIPTRYYCCSLSWTRFETHSCFGAKSLGVRVNLSPQQQCGSRHGGQCGSVLSCFRLLYIWCTIRFLAPVETLAGNIRIYYQVVYTSYVTLILKLTLDMYMIRR